MLVDALRAAPKPLRLKAAIKLASFFKDEKATEILLQSLHSPDSEMRKSIVLALGRLAILKTKKPLIEAARDPVPLVALAAAVALMQFN